MTNLERVVELVKSRNKIISSNDRKETIQAIVELLKVSKGNAAVYFTKAQKIVDPKPVTRSVVRETIVYDSVVVDKKIQAIIDKANNYVFTL